ncbi:MAG: FAD-dependent oxidoreductase [Acinetobacter sp.]
MIVLQNRTHPKAKKVDYDRLIIATGSKPFIPPVQGVDLKGVISFRDIYDVNTKCD